MKPAWHDVIATLAEVRTGPGPLPGGFTADSGLAAGAPPDVARKQAEARQRLIVRRMPTLVWSTDTDLRITSCLGAGLEGLERRPEHLVGCRLGDAADDRQGHLDAHRRALAGESVDYEGVWLDRWFACQVEPLADGEGRVCGTVGAAVEITELKRAHQRLAEAALRDGLTGLPSRSAFHERLARALSAERPVCALLLLNIDGFKSLNEGLGHAAGDRLLAEVAQRLTRTARSRDEVGRFVGDEFVVLMEDVPDAAHARKGADRVLAALREPVELAGVEVVPQASAGLALARPGQAPEALLREAESALLEAKVKSRGRCQVFEGPVDARALALLRMEAELRRALDRHDFRAHYEPTVSVKSSKVTGFEIVLWRRSAARARLT